MRNNFSLKKLVKTLSRQEEMSLTDFVCASSVFMGQGEKKENSLLILNHFKGLDSSNRLAPLKRLIHIVLNVRGENEWLQISNPIMHTKLQAMQWVILKSDFMA